MLLNCLPILSVYGFTPLLHKHILEHISAESHILFSAFVYFTFAVTASLIFFQDSVNKDFSIIFKKPYLIGLIFLYAAALLFIGDYLYFKVLHNNKAFLITAVLAAYPLITLAISYWFFEEKIELAHIVGSLFIVGGIILVTR
jgi:drug/metabolite transporter (DMT)-like permease